MQRWIANKRDLDDLISEVRDELEKCSAVLVDIQPMLDVAERDDSDALEAVLINSRTFRKAYHELMTEQDFRRAVSAADG